MNLGRRDALGPAVGAIAMVLSWGAVAADEPAEDIVVKTKADIASTNLTPRDLGSRYGQALGAVELCTGAKITEKASALPAVYSGAELDAFNVQQKKIYDAWLRVKHCVREDDPNQCKVIIDESCAAVLTEIGPKGTAFPGLIEFSKP